mgnify:CR=1 FL=1
MKLLSVFKWMMPCGCTNDWYNSMNRVEVSRFLTFFICGSGKVIHISLISLGAKKRVMDSILVRRKAALRMCCVSACLAPAHSRAPLISTPIKFLTAITDLRLLLLRDLTQAKNLLQNLRKKVLPTSTLTSSKKRRRSQQQGYNDS